MPVNTDRVTTVIRGDDQLTPASRRAGDSLRRVGNRARNTGQQFRQATANANLLRNALGAIGAAALVNRLRTITIEIVNVAATLRDQAQAIGFTVDEYRALTRVAAQFGIEQNDVRTALTSVSRRVGELQLGLGEAVQTFQLLNLTAADFVGLNASQSFQLIVDAVSRIEDAPQRLAVLQRLFEEIGPRFDPLFREGAGAVAAAVREQQRASAATNETNRAVTGLRLQFQQLGFVIQDQQERVLAAYAEDITRLLREIGQFVGVIADVALRIQPLIGSLSRFFGRLAFIGTTLPGIVTFLGIFGRELSTLTTLADSGGRQVTFFRSALQGLATLLLNPVAALRALISNWQVFLGVLGRVAVGVSIVVPAFDFLYETFVRRIPQGTEQAVRSIAVLEDRIAELQERAQRLSEGGLFGIVTPGDLVTLNRTLEELERLRNRLAEVRAEQARLAAQPPGRAFGPPLPPDYFGPPVPAGYDRTAALRQLQQEAEARREAAAAQEALNQRIAQYNLLNLRERGLAAGRTAQAAIEVERLGRVQQETAEAVAGTVTASVTAIARGAGSLAADLERIRQNARASETFVADQVLTAQSEQIRVAIDAQVDLGRLTEAEGRARLVVAERIADLQRQRLTATGMERDRIDAILNDLQTRYPEIVAELEAAFSGLTERVQQQTMPLVTIAEAFTSSLERGIRRAVREGGKLRDIMAQIGQEILGGVLAAITGLLTRTLLGAIGLPIPGRQFGGPVSRGRPYIVGERGPELFVPNQSGNIRANAAGAIVINMDNRGGDTGSINAAIDRAIPRLSEIFGAGSVYDVRFLQTNPSSFNGGVVAA